MPCNHKFLSHLNLERINYEPTTLIVGSFNPVWPDSNTAGWFYGRTLESCFWDVLPRLYGEPSLIKAGPEAWQEFCRDKKIALTDLISTIEDADENSKKHQSILGGFSDKAIMYNFEDFAFTNIIKILQNHPSIQNVYITRGITEAFWRHLWNPAARYCNLNHLHERKLLMPSDDSAYHHEAHNEKNPGDVIHRLEDYILRRWKGEWHF